MSSAVLYLVVVMLGCFSAVQTGINSSLTRDITHSAPLASVFNFLVGAVFLLLITCLSYKVSKALEKPFGFTDAHRQRPLHWIELVGGFFGE